MLPAPCLHWYRARKTPPVVFFDTSWNWRVSTSIFGMSWWGCTGASVDRQRLFWLLCSVSSLSTRCEIVRPAGSCRPFCQVRINITMVGRALALCITVIQQSHLWVNIPWLGGRCGGGRNFGSSLLYYKAMQVELRSCLIHFTDNSIWATMYCTYLINFFFQNHHNDSSNCWKWSTSLKHAALS